MTLCVGLGIPNRVGPSLLWLLGASCVLFAEGTAHAADDKELPSEHTIIIGFGGATEYELGNG